MKRIIPVLLAFLFLYSSCGFYLLQLVHLNNCTRVSAARRCAGEMESLLLSENDFEKTGDGELLYQGKMYDVVNELRSGDKILFYVFHDEKEDHIMASLKFHIQNFFGTGSKRTNSPVKHTIKFIVKDFSTISAYLFFSPGLSFSLLPAEARSIQEDAVLSSVSPPPWQA